MTRLTINVAAPTAGAVCTPDVDDGRDPLVWHLMCGTYPTGAPSATVDWASGHSALLVTAVLLVMAAQYGLRTARMLIWRRAARRARWLEIVPPASATPAATVALWRLLATLLPTPWPGWLRPPRLVWEVEARHDRMRCGLWVPPGMSTTAVRRVTERAWPGARITDTSPPQLPAGSPIAGRRLRPTRAEWLPLLETTAPMLGRRHESRSDIDRARAVFDGLAAAGRTGGGLLQIVVVRAPRHRVAALRRATVDPTRTRTGRPGLRLLSVVAEMARRGVIAGLDLLTPGPTPRGDHRRPADPYATQLARAARDKYADAPHLLVQVSAVAAGPTRAAARAAAADITSGFGLLGPYLHPRPLRQTRSRAGIRWAHPARMSLVSVTELAMLAGLPAEPTTFGMPAALARHRLPAADTWRAHRPTV